MKSAITDAMLRGIDVLFVCSTDSSMWCWDGFSKEVKYLLEEVKLVSSA
jgi:hypothetical protein